ncbi:MAG: glycoside hydrolase family 57 [Betaproteobacteria bacterium]|nr:glycoside hydrolase family 57 [Betaproteobacteria bacterium]
MTAYHALVLNLHQPHGNLEHLLAHDEWAAREILYALDRMPRVLWGHEDLARVHLSLSGTLLETLSDPAFQSKAYGIVDCGALLWHLQNERLFKVLGTGYYHPVLPLIPEGDREQHIARWLGIGRHLFWRPGFSGFWPPEMGFCMELIPLLKRFGYRYVLVDSAHVRPLEPMSWQELRYRPHLARHGGEEIVVIVRDRELSDAQESGMDFGWFRNEVRERTKGCDFAPLVTTGTDGDNGGWFRNTDARGNFWGVFYRELLEQARGEHASVRPTFIDDYLDVHGAQGQVHIEAGAWNTGWHDGVGFVQWTGSALQREALANTAAASGRLADARARLGGMAQDSAVGRAIEETYWHILRAQTSCHFYWGEAWVSRCDAELAAAGAAFADVEEALARQGGASSGGDGAGDGQPTAEPEAQG